MWIVNRLDLRTWIQIKIISFAIVHLYLNAHDDSVLLWKLLHIQLKCARRSNWASFSTVGGSSTRTSDSLLQNRSALSLGDFYPTWVEPALRQHGENVPQNISNATASSPHRNQYAFTISHFVEHLRTKECWTVGIYRGPQVKIPFHFRTAPGKLNQLNPSRRKTKIKTHRIKKPKKT